MGDFIEEMKTLRTHLSIYARFDEKQAFVWTCDESEYQARAMSWVKLSKACWFCIFLVFSYLWR